jgi:7-cyano-7-deazaguanine synthase
MNAIILCSGGLDSSTVAYHVKKKLNPKKSLLLFFDYSQKSLKEELFCVKKISENLKIPYKIIKLDWLGEISTAFINKEGFKETKEEDLGDIKKQNQEITSWWVPCRNALFILTALAHAESFFISNNEKYDIFLGIKKEGQVPMKDTTPKFLKKINELAQEATKDGNYKIIAPLIDKDKDEVVSLASELEVPYGFTFSCYIGSGFKDNLPVHCGSCSNCMQRKKAFYWSNIKDPSFYKL